MFFLKRLRIILQCNYRLNKRFFCLKRSWDEVSRILDHACTRRRRHHGRK